MNRISRPRTGGYAVRHVLVVLALALGLAGCGDKLAAGVASQTLKSVMTYEQSVRAKIAAERAFYTTQREAIQHRLIGYSPVSDAAPAGVDPSKTVYYGRIRVSAERDARLLGERIVTSDRPEILGGAMDYVGRGVADERDLRVALTQRDRELTVRLIQELEALDLQEARLALVRQRLVSLSQQPGTTDQLKALREIGGTIIKTLTAK
jgi:hypothetical protein